MGLDLGWTLSAIECLCVWMDVFTANYLVHVCMSLLVAFGVVFSCGNVYQFVIIYVVLPSLLKNKLLSMLLLVNLSDHCIVTEREKERYGPIQLILLCCSRRYTHIHPSAFKMCPSRADRNKSKICNSSLSKLTQSKWKRGRRRVREEGGWWRKEGQGRRGKRDLPSKMIRASIGVLMRPKKVSIEL